MARDRAGHVDGIAFVRHDFSTSFFTCTVSEAKLRDLSWLRPHAFVGNFEVKVKAKHVAVRAIDDALCKPVRRLNRKLAGGSFD
jgi:hypothetical protein